MSPEGGGRRGAFREAKRQNDVPVSQQPNRVGSIAIERGTDQEEPMNSRFLLKVVERARCAYARTRRVTTSDPGISQNRGPHFNDESGNHYDY